MTHIHPYARNFYSRPSVTSLTQPLNILTFLIRVPLNVTPVISIVLVLLSLQIFQLNFPEQLTCLHSSYLFAHTLLAIQVCTPIVPCTTTIVSLFITSRSSYTHTHGNNLPYLCYILF